MKEYIDREAVFHAMKMDIRPPFAVVRDFPAADVAPVVHGKNITEMHPSDEFVCSECGIDITDFCRYDPEEDATYEYEFKYCPNCGAKMDGEQNVDA